MRLPPFINLIAFDAAARQGTFTRAAGELNVSQPAISRRVSALEADLGVSVVSRATKPLQLTEAGEKLFDVLRAGLSRLEATVQDIRSQAGDKIVTISAGPGFASFWLLPRLPTLQAAFPDHGLRIVSSSHSDDATQGDLQIRFGDGAWPGVEAVKIMGEDVFAVCSPIYLAGRPAPLPIHEIQSARLLRLPDETPNWYGWSSWFEALGSPLTRASAGLDFDSYSLLVGAALAGQGMALCWAGLLDAYLDSGALVRVSRESVRSPRGYFVSHREGAPARGAIRAISRWLQGAAAQRAEPPEPGMN